MLPNGSCYLVGHNAPTLYCNYYYAEFVLCQQFAQVAQGYIADLTCMESGPYKKVGGLLTWF